MNALRILVVDDEAPARQRLLTLLNDIAAECPHEVVGDVADAQSALHAAAALKPDLMLLDVQMPEVSGLELAAHVRKILPEITVVFVSAHDRYALQAFDVHALDYLLKPVRAARLAEALARVIRRGAPAADSAEALRGAAAMLQQHRRHFAIHERGRLTLVPVEEVLCLRAEQKYLTVRTAGRDYLLEESLQSIEDEMPNMFVRVHRNALVARQAILSLERIGAASQDGDPVAAERADAWQIVLRGLDERLPVSRRQLPAVREALRR